MCFRIETDHKPLIPLFSSKSLNKLPIRVQRFRLRLMRYDFSISHVSGKDLTMADTLSRAPVSAATNIDKQLSKAFVDLIVKNLPATEKCLQDIQSQHFRDLTFSQVKYYCQKGWPSMPSIKVPLKLYVPVKGELSVYKGRGQ